MVATVVQVQVDTKGKVPGARHYSDAELGTLLNLIKQRKPYGTFMWDMLADIFNTSSTHQRTGEDLRKKYRSMVNSAHKTGDPTCPPRIKEAKRIDKEISMNMDFGETNSDDEEELKVPASVKKEEVKPKAEEESVNVSNPNVPPVLENSDISSLQCDSASRSTSSSPTQIKSESKSSQVLYDDILGRAEQHSEKCLDVLLTNARIQTEAIIQSQNKTTQTMLEGLKMFFEASRAPSVIPSPPIQPARESRHKGK